MSERGYNSHRVGMFVFHKDINTLHQEEAPSVLRRSRYIYTYIHTYIFIYGTTSLLHYVANSSIKSLYLKEFYKGPLASVRKKTFYRKVLLGYLLTKNYRILFFPKLIHMCKKLPFPVPQLGMWFFGSFDVRYVYGKYRICK